MVSTFSWFGFRQVDEIADCFLRQPMSPNVAADIIRFVRDRNWKLYETGELYDLNADIDEEMPIYESDDGENSAAARAKLKPIFAQMV